MGNITRFRKGIGMSLKVIVHCLNEMPILGDIEEIPKSPIPFITLHNPRSRGEKPLEWSDTDMRELVIAVHAITFIEVIATKGTRESMAKFGPVQTN